MLGSKRVAAKKRATTSRVARQTGTAIRAVGYVRVSTADQVEGYGLDVQERAIRAFALSQGYELVDVIADPGVSGAKAPIDRPGFGKIIDLAAAKAVDILLVYKFDRLARNALHAISTVHNMRDRYSVGLRSVTEPIDTNTAMGEMIFTVLASMAAQERQTITERTWSGRAQKARGGGFAGGRAPYGYRKEGGELVVVPAEAEIVRRIIAERAAKTLEAIAAGLNADGIPSPNGGAWHPSRIAYIADNPKYRGALEYLFTWQGDVQHVLKEGAHEAILASAT